MFPELTWWGNLELVNIGIRIIDVTNVIVRGLTISKVRASTDAIGEFLECFRAPARC